MVSNLFLLHHLYSNRKDCAKSGNFLYDVFTGALTISSLLHWHRYIMLCIDHGKSSRSDIFVVGAK